MKDTANRFTVLAKCEICGAKTAAKKVGEPPASWGWVTISIREDGHDQDRYKSDKWLACCGCVNRINGEIADLGTVNL